MTPELPSAHIWGLVCGYATPYRRRKLLLMLKGYIDDSGSEPSAPDFVLAGYVLPAEVWAHFSDEWAAELLRGRPIEYLHMKEIGRHERIRKRSSRIKLTRQSKTGAMEASWGSCRRAGTSVC